MFYQLDALIEDSEKFTSHLRTFRNSAPINRLPPECISAILVAACLQPEKRAPYSYLKILQFGLVSKYWRNVTRSYARLWTSMSDKDQPEIWGDAMERSKAASLEVYCLRAPRDFIEVLRPHVQRIKFLDCIVRLGRDPRTGVTRVSPNFSRSSPILETLRIESEGRKDLPPEVELGVLPEDSASLKALCLRHAHFTNQLLRLTTLTTLEFLHHTINLTTLLDFLAANDGLENLKATCREITVHFHNHREVTLSRLRRFELSSLTVKPVLAALQIPPTAVLNIEVLLGGRTHTHLHDVLPSSLDGLPTVAQVASLQQVLPRCLVKSSLGPVPAEAPSLCGIYSTPAFRQTSFQ